jgi:coenzyme F420-reducing hydrogenase delta subunit
MKATLLLRKDHETMRALLDQLRRPARGKDKATHFEGVRREILTHLKIEDDLFYPEILSAPEADAQVVETASQHHREIEDLLNGAVHENSSALDALAEKMEEHFAFEEEHLMEQARLNLSEYRLEELGLEMEDRRRMLRLSAA